MRLSTSLAMLALALMCLAGPALAEQAPAGEIVYMRGQGWVWHEEEKLAAQVGMQVYTGDVVLSEEAGRIKIQMVDQSTIYVGSQTRMTIQEYRTRDSSLVKGGLDMLWGKARFIVSKLKKGASFDVQTKTAVLGVRGTAFGVLVPPPEVLPVGPVVTFADIPPVPTRAITFEGRVLGTTITGVTQVITPGITADFHPDGTVEAKPTERTDIEQMPAAKAKGKEGKEGEKKAAPAKQKPAAKAEGKEGAPARQKPAAKAEGKEGAPARQKPAAKAGVEEGREQAGAAISKPAAKPAQIAPVEAPPPPPPPSPPPAAAVTPEVTQQATQEATQTVTQTVIQETQSVTSDVTIQPQFVQP